jgi:hypothetical protein
MNRTTLFTLLVLVASTEAANAVKILTPNEDSCLAFTTAMDTADALKLIGLGGWPTGFVSGVAQGTGLDYLRNYDVTSVTQRLYDSCRRQPDKMLSLVAEELARSMITEQGLMPTRPRQ